MPILLREYENFDPKDKKHPLSFKEGVNWSTEQMPIALKEWYANNPDEFFKVMFEAIHADIPTVNFTRYLKEGLNSSIPSWTDPYKIPVIMYHNDFDGQIIGRVTSASIGAGVRRKGTECLLLEANIPGWETQHNVKNGILDTVSVGMSGTDVRCSICGTKISDGDFCEHVKGREYNGKTCYWDVYEAYAKEISFVILPSDKYAGVIEWHDPWEDASCHDGERKPEPVRLSNSASEDSDKSSGVDIKEGCQGSDETSERKTDTLDLKEAEQKISSLETANKALSGDKAALQANIDTLNNDKIKLQESVKDLNGQIEAKELELSNEKSLREAAEKKIDSLTQEVKTSLVETFVSLRESAGKPAIENVEERSIDSLRDSIADLRAELKESEEQAKKDKEKKETIDAKGTADDVSLKEGDESASKKEPDAPATSNNFEL